jgi:hypothetical protein
MFPEFQNLIPETINCSNYGEALKPGLKTCPQCRKPVQGKVAAALKFCGGCGSLLGTGVFKCEECCSQCGKTLLNLLEEELRAKGIELKED